ncbi:MAG: penicillin-binding protein 2 [Actinomycetota bacterium]
MGVGFVAVLVDLQTVRSDNLRSLSEDQRTRTRQLAGYRGDVLDRNGVVLAASSPSHRVVADPTLVKDPGRTAALLAPLLGIDSGWLVDELTPTSETDRFSLLARHVNDDAVAGIADLNLAGIFTRPEEDRVYPAGDVAAAVVGRVDPDEQGIYGVEQQYNDAMTGAPGTEQYERGRFGSITVGSREVDPATRGSDVTLTIDNRLQYVTEEMLVGHCEETRAAGATAVVSDPRTGEILAMASAVRDEGVCGVPRYAPALVDSFEPGSVIKPFVVAATMQELGYTSDTVIDVPSRTRVGDKTFVDHPPHPGAPFAISDILAESSNVGTIKLAQRLAPETVYGYMTAFGLGQRTGLDTEGEAAGVLRHPDDWYGSDHGSIPIGQGVTVTATQLLAAYNVIANGGRYTPPSLVRSIEGADGVSTLPQPESRQVLQPEIAADLTHSLTAVVARGTGAEAAVAGYPVAGKTGTAWKVFDDGSGRLGYGTDTNRRYVVSFVGFLPADDPQLSVVVMVDEPKSDTTAATIAAPLFAQIAEYSTRILGIPPLVSATDGAPVRGTPAPPSGSNGGSREWALSRSGGVSDAGDANR